MTEPPHRPRAGPPVERVRGDHPADEAWRADALARSRHSDLRDEISPPLDDHDAEAAAAVCGEICRRSLGGLAAGLLLLGTAERRRAQAAAACAVTLFDFARQSGLEGEKLAQINRWELELERALSATPAGQPIFVQIARLQEESAWAPGLFDGLVAAARRRVTRPRPRDERRLAEECRDLGALALLALGVETPSEGALRLAALLVRARRLLALGEELRRGRPGLPESALPPGWEASSEAEEALRVAAVAEQERIAGELAGAREAVRELPGALRPAARFAVGAARRLVERFEPQRPLPAPELGLGERLWLLLRSRWR